MAIIPEPSLFSWEQVEAASDLDRPRGELDRSAPLRQLRGFDGSGGSRTVPPQWVYTRFPRK